MCGIFFYTGPVRPTSELYALFMKIKHRGPDNSQFHVMLTENGSRMVVLGFHRLSINGIAPYDEQPFIKDKLYTMCNGEIWNHADLELANTDTNININTTSDCACLLPGYAKYGMKALCQSIDGVFGLLVYDEINNSVNVARDPVGIRSLYWNQDHDSLFIASELKAFPSALTTVTAFPPGHYATATLGSPLEFECYIQKPLISYNPNTPDSTMTELHDTLTKAVEKRLMSGRPVGCILSGGLDSTLVTAIVCKLQRERGITDKMRTYTIGLEGGEDLKWARLASEYLGTEHHEFVVSETDFLDAIPTVIKSIESYDVTTVRASTGNWLVAKKIAELKKDVVLFCGDVADELLGGYRGFGLAKTASDFEAANVKMMSDVHRFDVLRSEKSFTAHGLEGRVPFADKDVLRCVAQFPSAVKMWSDNQRIEKQLLRETFEGYLPKELLWRRKEAFSDGVSSTHRSWYSIIQSYLEKIHPHETDSIREHMPPYDIESSYYRHEFEHHYASVKCIPYFWKHPFTTEIDPSARKLVNY